MDSQLPNIILLIWVIGAIITAASQVIKPDCQEKCGEVSIPYPFGTKDGCYLNKDFHITCTKTSSPPKPFLWTGNIEVLNISVDGELRVLLFVAKDCYNSKGERLSTDAHTILPRFPFSYTRNKFVAIGCDTYAVILGKSEESVQTGCLSVCNSEDSVSDGSCSGIGCCQTSIPKGVLNYNVSVGSYNNHTSILDFNPCSYSFLAEEDSFNFSKAYLKDFNRSYFPAVLDWAVGTQRCEEAKKNLSTYACKSNISTCYDSDNGPGYRCNCSAGYQGNPYLPDGCKDINECADPKLNNCKQKYCTNTVGGFECKCPKGYLGNGTQEEGCVAPNQSFLIKITVGIGGSLMVLLMCSGCLYLGYKKKRLLELKDMYFRKNGGLMLKEQLSTLKGSNDTAAKIYVVNVLYSTRFAD